MPQDEQGIAASGHRWHVIPRTLCFVLHGDDVLLLKAASDKRIWPGMYNGIGGHVEHDETILEAAAREVHEETDLEVGNLRLRGIVNIDAGNPTKGIVLFVFTAHAPQRNTIPSDEGTLEWHAVNRLPGDNLLEDLTTLLPRALAQGEQPFFAHYRYDDDENLQIIFSDT